jgi:serine/threonine protein kinase
VGRWSAPTERAVEAASRPVSTRPTRNQTLIDRYQLVSEGFRGAFARVFRAADLQTPGRFVAIKFPADLRSAEHLRRFRKELETLAALHHPNVLKVVEQYPDHKPPFAVFEYLSGGTLHDVLRSGPLAFPALVLLLGEIAGALASAHVKNGFHRDVKPHNIMFDADGRCVLIDWNLASLPAPGDGSRFTRGFGGTRGYIDPWVVNKDFDAAADIYSFAITIAEAATGKPPELLVPELDLRVEPREIAAPTPEQAAALVRLLEAMMRRERALRPDAIRIQEFSAALAGGGGYPPLAGEAEARSAPRRLSGTSALNSAAYRRLTGVGVAVLLGA